MKKKTISNLYFVTKLECEEAAFSELTRKLEKGSKGRTFTTELKTNPPKSFP